MKREMTMQRLSVYENTTPGWSFEEDVRNYQKAGINGIGVGYDKIRDMEIEDVAKILHDSGLQVSSLALTGFYTQDKKSEKSCHSVSGIQPKRSSWLTGSRPGIYWS